MKEDLLKIINNYSVLSQLKQFNEETYELIEAIIKKEEDYQFSETTVRIDKENIRHIAEEIADCYVMLEQFRLYYDISDMKVKDIMINKINRQLERMNNEKDNESEREEIDND